MTAFDGPPLRTQETSTEHIRDLLRAIQEMTRQLEKAQQERRRAEDETVQCSRETERREDLMMGKSEVFDSLQQLGALLQEERLLSKELDGQATANRNLRDSSARVSFKATSLAAEILEVKQHLEEAKARRMAAQALIHTPTAQALIHTPTRKTKRSQRKPK